MAKTKHGQLVAGTPRAVVIDSYCSMVTVVNRSQTGEIYFTVDGSTPAPGADGTYAVLGARVVATPNITSVTTVTLISVDALMYSVEGETQ